MYGLQKSAAAPLRSRQSSVDSRTSHTSIPEQWVPPTSDTTIPSDADHALHGKRGSIFGIRSRSDTATSSASFKSRNSSMTETEASSHCSSQPLSSVNSSRSSFLDLTEDKTRSFFSRGKRMRRQSSQVSFGPSASGAETHQPGKRTSLLRTSRSRNGPHGVDDDAHHWKHRISSPFNFHHVTHTQHQHFRTLERASENELVAEYWTVRASQTAQPQLQGIKADDLHFKNFSSETLNEDEVAGFSNSRTPPMLSPKRSADLLTAGSLSPTMSRRSLRHSRSVDSFSQPFVKSRSPRTSGYVSPPVRTSSRTATSPSLQMSPPSGHGVRTSSHWDRPGYFDQQVNHDDEQYDSRQGMFAHAFTTPEDIAMPAVSPGFSALENVPEESEPSHCAADMLGHELRRPGSSRQRSRRQTVIYEPSALSPPLSSGATRPTSQMSDTLASPFQSTRSGALKRVNSIRIQTSFLHDDSWEDDIDYCYDHAAEANCDYDWSSATTPLTPNHPPSASRKAKRETAIFDSLASPEEDGLRTTVYSGVFGLPLDETSELTNESSFSSAGTEAETPAPTEVYRISQSYSFVRPDLVPNEHEVFNFTPSLLVPPNIKHQEALKEVSYEELINAYASSERHYTALEHTRSIGGASSARSSRTRHSKRSSYDSSVLSSGTLSLSSPLRRSASSSGSLPELVHSRRARKNFDALVDQLTDQMASFADIDRDESSLWPKSPVFEEAEPRESTDTTHTVTAATSERTFFAADDDSVKSRPNTSYGPPPTPPRKSSRRAFTPSNTRNSSESTITTSPPKITVPTIASALPSPAVHGRAASDSAAKVLAGSSTDDSVLSPVKATSDATPKQRQRASSVATTKKKRQSNTYTLSLFPTPPKATRV